MPIRQVWQTGTNYAPPQQVYHESVLLQCTLPHVSVAGASGNEPDVAPDTTWQLYWEALTPFWGDYMYSRLPQWVQQLDLQNDQSLYWFLRIIGRGMNQNDDDGQTLELIKDSDQTPTEYLDAYAATLGILLPHAFDTLDPDAAHRILSAIVALYKRKGCLPSIEWITTQYLGYPVTIFYESVTGHYFGMTYNDTVIPPNEANTIYDQVLAIAALYAPAGLIPVIIPQSQPYPVGELGGGQGIGGYANHPYTSGKGVVQGGNGTTQNSELVTDSSWSGTNPNTATGGFGGGWVSASAPAIITLPLTNFIAFNGIYTLSYNLVGVGNPIGSEGNVRVQVSYSISGGGYTIYGTTPPQLLASGSSGISLLNQAISVNLSGLLSGATSVSFELLAQAQYTGGRLNQSVLGTVTGVSAAWLFAATQSPTNDPFQLNVLISGTTP